MQNLVGSVIPTQKEIETLLKELAQLDGRIAEFIEPQLSTDDRKHLLRPRPGGDKVAQLVGRLAVERNVTLPGISVEAMNADLTLAERLRPLLAAVQAIERRVADGLLLAESEAWQAANAFYSVLASISTRDPALGQALKPAVDFFALGKRKPKSPPPQK